MIRRRLVLAAVGATMVMTVACACGNQNVSSPAQESTTQVEVMQENANPFAEITDQLKDGQGYAVVELGDTSEAMLVADQTFDNMNGTMAATEAKLYTVDANGEVVDNGTVASSSASTPLAVKDNNIYFCTHHSVGKVSVDAEGKADIVELKDSDNDYETVYGEYTEATAVAFTVVGENANPFAEITGQLKDGQGYAVVELGDTSEAMLVADQTFDNMDGTMAATEAKLYTVDANGEVVDNGTVASSSASTPLAVKDNSIYFCTHHSVGKVSVDAEGKADVVELKDSDNDYETVYSEYTEATAVAFTVVGQN